MPGPARRRSGRVVGRSRAQAVIPGLRDRRRTMGRLLRAGALGLALWGLVAWASVTWDLGARASADESPVVTAAPAAAPIVDVARVSGVIDAVNAQYLARVVQQAEADQAT